jgi:hypothetical protein
MKQTIPAVSSILPGVVLGVLLGVLASVTACSGAHGSGQGREGTALAPNGGRGGVASPWLDDPESYQGPASNEPAPVAEEAEEAEEEADGLGAGGGDDAGGEGGDDLGEGDTEPEIEFEEGWGGDEEWEEDPEEA